jgi:hypothetical protein
MLKCVVVTDCLIVREGVDGMMVVSEDVMKPVV